MIDDAVQLVAGLDESDEQNFVAAHARADLAELNEREREVAIAVAEGLTNADIARQHFMSLAAVKAHVTRILEKWGASNRVQIAIRVHDAELD